MTMTESERVSEIINNVETSQRFGLNLETKRIEPMNSYSDPDRGWIPISEEDMKHAINQRVE